jgi:hypothetical protein
MLALAMRYLLAFLLMAGGAAQAKPARYHFELGEVTVAPSAPAELSVKARAVFDDLTRGRADVVQTLENPPDPSKDPAGYRKYLAARGLRAYALKLKIDEYDRSFGPTKEPGKSGNVLTVRLNVSLVGAQIPGDVLALAGSGGATVIAEVGPTLQPREEEGATDDALKDALSHALDDAIAKLNAPPPKKAKKK